MPSQVSAWCYSTPKRESQTHRKTRVVRVLERLSSYFLQFQCRLIAAQEEFLVVLKSLRVYRAELDNVILVDDYPGGGDALFKSLNNLEDASQEFLDRLTHGFAADPRCEEPLGQLLTHAAQRLRNPTIDFCDDLTTKVEVVSKYPIESTTSTNTFDKEDIIKAMEQPFLHVQRYPHFVNSIMKVSEVEMSASVALDLQVGCCPW